MTRLVTLTLLSAWPVVWAQQQIAYDFSVTFDKRGSNPNCTMAARYIAVGSLGFLESWSGGMSGDVGNRTFAAQQWPADININQTIRRDLPPNAGYAQTFSHAHIPYETGGVGELRTGSVPACWETGGADDCSEADPPTGGGGGGDPPPGGFKRLMDDCISPLLVDLGRNGFHLGGAENPVPFDLLAEGYPQNLQWVAPDEDDAFLVMDLNHNGLVDDGAELFGNGTAMLLGSAEKAPNGFVALGQYDHPDLGGNGDGYITGEDLIWDDLALWLDADADGVCGPGELTPLHAASLTRFDTIPHRRGTRDRYGNVLRYWAEAQDQTGMPTLLYDLVDVYFRVVP